MRFHRLIAASPARIFADMVPLRVGEEGRFRDMKISFPPTRTVGPRGEIVLADVRAWIARANFLEVERCTERVRCFHRAQDAGFRAKPRVALGNELRIGTAHAAGEGEPLVREAVALRNEAEKKF